MAHIPSAVLNRQVLPDGLQMVNQGKVRNTFALLDQHILPVATDRCSVFDFVLNTEIPDKGYVLTGLNHFWTTHLSPYGVATDFVAAGSQIDKFLPERLRGNTDLQRRATVVKKCKTPDYEDIVRFILTGSSVKTYEVDRMVCGHLLPGGLIDGSMLPYPLYTPSTKAQVGHDEPIDVDIVGAQFGAKRERRALQIATIIFKHAKSCGILFGDTKFEFWEDKLIDEKGTPDSSRFMDYKEWEKAHAKGKLPKSLDKQYVREWAKKALIEKDATGRKREPTNEEDLAFVDAQEVPADVVKMTTRLYRYIFWRLTGKMLEIYQRYDMNVNIGPPRRRIEILVGSDSDRDQITAGLVRLRSTCENFQVSIMSGHRNPAELHAFTRDVLTKADVVIAGAGMAAVLPGMVKSELCSLNCSQIPVIGVAFKGRTYDHDRAAVLSIECIPEQPVELDSDGSAYFGADGFRSACVAAISNEFLPKAFVKKPAQIGIEAGP